MYFWSLNPFGFLDRPINFMAFHKAQALHCRFWAWTYTNKPRRKCKYQGHAHDVDKLTSWTLLQFSLVAWPTVPRQSSLRLACQWWYSVKRQFHYPSRNFNCELSKAFSFTSWGKSRRLWAEDWISCFGPKVGTPSNVSHSHSIANMCILSNLILSYHPWCQRPIQPLSPTYLMIFSIPNLMFTCVF